MKKTYITTALICLAALSSCDLDLFPETGYSEGNVKVDENTDESQYSTREDMKGLRDAIYASWTKDIQEKGYLDWLVYAECRADNAYGGNPGTGELMAIEANKQDAENKNVVRDWDWYLSQVSNCNNIICNIDRIKEADASMTDREYGEWKSEAYCWRAWLLFQMSQIWGDIPFVNTIPPAITAENIEEVYDAYFPSRTARADIYARIIKELEFACLNAPDVSHSDKFLFTKLSPTGCSPGYMPRRPRATGPRWRRIARLWNRWAFRWWTTMPRCGHMTRLMRYATLPNPFSR